MSQTDQKLSEQEQGAEIALRPQCPQGHGSMKLRAPERCTPEQTFCGVWYDCWPGPVGESCHSSVLLRSPALSSWLSSGGAA